MFLTYSWRETAEGHWTGVMGGRVWTLTQTDNALWYFIYKTQQESTHMRWIPQETSETKMNRNLKNEPYIYEEEEKLLRDYFQLNVNYGELYTEWAARDLHFKTIADTFSGQSLCCRIISTDS